MNALIVEDEADIRLALKASIARSGALVVDTAASAEEALGLAVQTRYDLVTVDIHLPGASGLDVVSVLRGLMPGSVIVIISANTDQVSRKEMQYVDLVLAKPFSVDTIRRLAILTKEVAEKRAAIRALGELEASV